MSIYIRLRLTYVPAYLLIVYFNEGTYFGERYINGSKYRV